MHIVTHIEMHTFLYNAFNREESNTFQFEQHLIIKNKDVLFNFVQIFFLPYSLYIF